MIDARRRRFPDQTPYIHRPLTEAGEVWAWDAAAGAGMKEDNLLDLSI